LILFFTNAGLREKRTRVETINIAHLHKTLAQGAQLTNLDRQECMRENTESR